MMPVLLSLCRWELSSTLRGMRAGRALWAGIRPRVMFHVPAAAITWSSYETMKVLLRDGTLTPV